MERLTIFETLLRTLLPGRYLDLGTGHGKFALVAHSLGWEVTAVDARRDRMPTTPEITWEVADVRVFSIDRFDCVGILGLLYHLELPDQLDLLQRASVSPVVILDTHYAINPRIAIEGYEGQWFSEKLTASTASWNNPRSFWPTRDSLIQMIYDCGYSYVWEMQPPYHPNRNFFILHS